MAKGLDVLLEHIRAEPKPTLIARYMALVQDLRDDREKSDLILRLASSLARSQPDEALRLAHEVYQLSPRHLEALDVMAEAFTAKGRFAKAAVLRLEREKLERAVPSEGSVLVGDSLPRGDALRREEDAKQENLAPGVEFDRILPSGLNPGDGLFTVWPEAEKATALVRAPVSSGGAEAGSPRVAHEAVLDVALASPLPVSGHHLSLEKSSDSASAPSPETDSRNTPPGGLSRRLLKRLMGRDPGDTILPFRSGAVSSTADAPSLGPPRTDERASISSLATVANSLAGSPQAPEPFERSRGQPFAPAARRGRGSSTKDLPKAPPMWQALGPELERLRQRLPLRPLEESESLRLRELFATHPRGAALPGEFVKTLAELDHRLKGSDPAEVLTLKWDLFQGLWGFSPTGACADLLRALGLRHATPAFWGLYLDGLISDRKYRVALQDIRQTLISHPHLNWARVVSLRLPIIWEGLRVYGFAWHEEDGIEALVKGLGQRPRPKLASLIGMSFTHKRVGQ